MRTTKSNCLGYELFTGFLTDILPVKKTIVNTINQYSYCIAQKDAAFKKALTASDILLPDGIGIVAASGLITGLRIKKIAGADLHQHLLEHLNQINGSCFYLGSSESTLSKIKDRLSKEFPGIRADFYSPPFKSEFNAEDNTSMIAAVNAFKPDVLFVGMTAPKQEKWVSEHKKQLNAKLITSIGAVFDFYAGTIDRPGKIWIYLGLEWFARLLKEPRRMWRRYLFYGPIFIFEIFQEKWKQVNKHYFSKHSLGNNN